MPLSINTSLSAIIAHKLFVPCFIGIVVLFSFVVAPGYEVYTSDQALFLPPLFHKLDPALFENDLSWFNTIFTERTFLTDFFAFFVRLGIPILWVLFLWDLIIRILFFASLFYIIYYFTGNRSYSIVALLFFITPLKTFGTGHGTMETSFSYRAFSLTFGLTFIAFYLYEKIYGGISFILLAFMIHPITTLPFLLFYGATECISVLQSNMAWKELRRRLLPFIIIGAGIVLFLATKASGVSENLFLRIDEAWKQLAYPRNSPAFFAFWDRNSYISLVGWFLLGSIPFLSLSSLVPTKNKRMALYILGAIPIILLVVSAFGEYFLLHGIVKFNLQRGLFLVNIVTAILIGFLAFSHAERERGKFTENAFLFAILAWFFYKEDFVFLREQMLFFVPSLVVLFYAGKTSIPRGTLLAASLGLFLLGYGVTISRTLVYRDFLSLLVFHGFIAVGILVASLYTYTLITSKKLLLSIITVAIPILLLSSLIKAPRFTIYPAFAYNRRYMDACAWVQNYTAKNSVFIVEPFVSGEPAEFRLACFRPIFTTFKDGGIAPYGRKEAFEWKRKYDFLYEIPKNWIVIETIKKQYRVDYIFSEKKLPIEQLYPLVFSNEKYYIYDIR